jgi:flagellar protein FlaG
MYHTEVVRDGNREHEERGGSVVSGKCGGIYILRPDDVDSFLGGLDVRRLPGVGRRMVADKKPTVQNFFTEKDQEDKDLSEEKDAKQGTQLKKAVNDLNKQMKNSEAIFGIHDKTNRVTIKIIDKTTKEVIKEYPPEETLDMIAKVWEIAGILVDEKL